MLEIIIIFNENILNLPLTHLKGNCMYHCNLIERINDAYEIYIDKSDYINDLINNNHIILTITNDVILCYIPKIITEKQYSDLLSIKDYILKFKSFYSFIMNEDSKRFFGENNIEQTVNDFYNYVEINCISKSR